MKRTVMILLVLLSLILLVSCNSDGVDTVETVQNESVEQTAVMDFILDTDTKVFIVIPEAAKNYEVRAAFDLQAYLKKNGIESEVHNDSEHDGSGRCIFIGQTKFSADKSDVLSIEKYGIFVSDGNVSILSSTENGMREAQVYFTVISNFVDGICTLAAGYEHIADAFDWGIPTLQSKSAKGVYDCGDSATMIVYQNASRSEFSEYSDKLEAEGYTRLDAASVGDNDFRTFVKDGVRVVTYYTGAYSEIRIIKDRAVSSYSSSAGGTAKVELFTSKSNHKAPYILRLSDNSVVLFDGDILLSEVGAQTKTLYDELTQICQSQSIVIRAWFISHVHYDHTHCFERMMKSEYAKNITLERVILNVSSYDDVYAVMPNLKGEDYQHYKTVQKVIDEYKVSTGKTAELIKTHTGELFNFCGVKFRILYTHEDYLPRTYPITGTSFKGNGINSHSLVMQMTYGDKTVIWTGDMSHEMSVIVEKMYGDALKCDAVQVGHHGANTCGYPSFYLKCDPDVLIWTYSYERFQAEVVAYNRAGIEVYNALMDRVQRHIFIGDGTGSYVLS